MNNIEPQLQHEAERVDTNKHKLAGRITNLHFKKNPDLENQFGNTAWNYCYEDALYHLKYLSESLTVESNIMFNNYLEWAHQMLATRNMPKDDLLHSLSFMKKAINEISDGNEMKNALEFIEKGIQHLKHYEPETEEYITPENPLYAEAKEYLDLLLKSKRHMAGEFIDDLVKKDIPVRDIYENIFQAVQYEVGVLWQRNEITVAQEHYCTAATQLIMSRLYPLIFSGEKNGNRLVACSVSRELHEIGIRMVADFFEMDGWDTYYLGSNVPDDDLIRALMEQNAELLAISVTLPIHLSKVKLLIEKIRNDKNLDSLKIMAGGYPFSIIPGLKERLGADATAQNARTAIEAANLILN